MHPVNMRAKNGHLPVFWMLDLYMLVPHIIEGHVSFFLALSLALYMSHWNGSAFKWCCFVVIKVKLHLLVALSPTSKCNLYVYWIPVGNLTNGIAD